MLTAQGWSHGRTDRPTALTRRLGEMRKLQMHSAGCNTYTGQPQNAFVYMHSKAVTKFGSWLLSPTLLTYGGHLFIAHDCSSVCVSRSSIVSKWVNISSYFLQHVVVQLSGFSRY